MIELLWIAAGLLCLLAGGHALILGANTLAVRFGIPPILIGLTVVAFGTSTPELAVSLFASLSDSPAISFGNVVGSNIANVGLLLGIAAILRPLTVHGQIVSREIPMLFLACVTTTVLAWDAMSADAEGSISRQDGAVLMLLFAVFLYYTFADALDARRNDRLADQTREAFPPTTTPAKATVQILAGLAGLVLGGHLFVDSGIAIARALAIPEVVIGVTIIAVGTSLPELVTSVLAARRGMTDLVIGNIVGSNIFNLLFVLGLPAVILPIDVPDGGRVDLWVMTGSTFVLLPLALTQRTISRAEGVLLLLAYLGYAAWQVTRSQ